MNKILVLGGTGFVGRHLCEKLVSEGLRVTVATRRTANAQAVQTLPLVDVLACDVHDESQLTRVVAGHDAVVNLVAILHGNAAAFEHAHVTLVQKLVRACTAGKVKRVVHVSALGAGVDAPSMYQRSKAAGEQVLQASALQWTVLRPSVIFGADDKFLNLFAKLQTVLPFMPLAGATTRFQPVWVQDVAQAIVACLQSTDTIGKTYEVCGPDVFTLKQLVQMAGQLSGVRGGRGRPVFGISMGLGRIQAAMMSLAPGEPLMSRDNLDSMAVDNVATGLLPGLAALGIAPASLATQAPLYLTPRSRQSSLQTMRSQAGRR